MAIACLFTVIYLVIHISLQSTLPIDELAYTFAVQTLRTPWLTPIMEGLSALASPLVLTVIVIIVGACSSNKEMLFLTATNLISVVIINNVFKEIVQRSRPEGYRLVTETGFSFPSGHSMAALAFFGLLAWMVLRSSHSKPVRYAYASFFCFLAFAIGFSRIYLGVHYASDVLGGFCVSGLWLLFFTQITIPKLSTFKKPKKEASSL